MLAETTLGALLQAIEADMLLKSRVKHPTKRKHPPKAAGYLGLSLVAAHFR